MKELPNGVVVKAMKNGLGEWAVYWGGNNKAVKLAYRRFFKDNATAEKWVQKFTNKLLR